MPDAADYLRSAADHLDDARTDLEYGDLEMPNDDQQEILEEIDDVAADLASTMRTVAINAEVEQEASTDS